METSSAPPMMAAALIAAVVVCPTTQAGEGAVCLAKILADHMVLQQGKPVRIWGWAAPGAMVKVTLTEDARLAALILARRPKLAEAQPPAPAQDDTAYRATIAYVERNAEPFETISRSVEAGADGAWEAAFPPMATSFKPKFVLAQSDDEASAAQDVLVGEVWICSGQSNMQRKGFEGSDLVVPGANLPGIRHCKFDDSWYEPLEDLREPVEWQVCTPETATQFASTSFLFALELHRYLRVPVGIINNARGGTTGQAWCSRDELDGIDSPHIKKILAAYDAACAPWESEAYRKKARAEQVAAAKSIQEKYERDLAAWEALPPEMREKTRAPQKPKLRATKPLRVDTVLGDPREGWSPPAGLFNAVVHPLRKLGISGLLYYQGENNNFGLWSQYELTFPRVIASHRKLFGDPKLPVGIVGLPAWKTYDQAPEVAAVADGYAIIRDIHARTAKATPRCDLISICDTGGAGIHPGDKRPVGERAARWALARVYGEPVYHTGPIYREMKIGEDKRTGRRIVRLYFDLDPLAQVAVDEHKRRFDKPAPGWLSLPCPRAGVPHYTGFIIAGKDRRWYPAEVTRNLGEPALEVSSPFVPEPVAVRYGWANWPMGNAVGRGGLPLHTFRTDDWPLPESWKYDKELTAACQEKIDAQITAARQQAPGRQMAEMMAALAELDRQRYLTTRGKGKGRVKAKPDQRGFLRSKTARIAAVIADLEQAHKDLSRRGRDQDPEFAQKLQALREALAAVEAEIDRGEPR